MDLLILLVKSGIVAGLLYGLFAYGLSLILSVNKVFHVAQGATFVLSAYVFMSLSTRHGWPVVLAVLGAMVAASVIAAAMHYGIYQPLARRDADPMVVMVASLLLVAMGQYVVELIWGSGVISLTVPDWFTWSTSVGSLRIDAYDVSVLVVSLVVFAGMHWFLQHTRPGLEFRAVGDNPERASALAINLDSVFLRSMILGSVLVVPAAALLSLKAPIHPMMGFDLLLKAVIALTIGGMGRMSGALVGGLLVGLTEALPPYWLPTEWAEFTLYILAFAFVILRPTGLVGGRRKPRRRAAVEPTEPEQPSSKPLTSASA